MVPSDTFYDESFAPLPAPEAGVSVVRGVLPEASRDGRIRWA